MYNVDTLKWNVLSLRYRTLSTSMYVLSLRYRSQSILSIWKFKFDSPYSTVNLNFSSIPSTSDV